MLWTAGHPMARSQTAELENLWRGSEGGMPPRGTVLHAPDESKVAPSELDRWAPKPLTLLIPRVSRQPQALGGCVADPQAGVLSTVVIVSSSVVAKIRCLSIYI